MRPTDVPDTGLLCDLLWSDPDKDVQVGFYLRNLSEGFQTVKSETKAGNTKCCLWNLSTKWNVKHTGSGFWYQAIPQILICRAGARFWCWFMNIYETITNPYLQGWGENDRGVSFTFGADVVSKFLNRHDLDLICRAHQVISCPSTLLYPVSLMIEGWD